MFVTAGFDELERKLQRGGEIDLGALGWQQVEDFPPEIEAQMRALHDWERQQADLSNQSADMRWNIDALKLQRKQLQKKFDGQLAQLEAALQPLVAAVDLAEKSIPGCQEKVRRFDEAISTLEEAHEAINTRLHTLMSETQTLQVRELVVELGDKRAAYENEREDLQRTRMKTAGEMKTFEYHIETYGPRIEELKRQIRLAKEDFAAQDKELVSQITSFEKEKQHAVKNVNTLDRKKSSAFLAIGRCLADSAIPPMNQPEALEKVLAHRGNILEIQQRIADSLARSSQIPSSTLTAFYVAMFLFLAVILIAAIALLGHHPHP